MPKKGGKKNKKTTDEQNEIKIEPQKEIATEQLARLRAVSKSHHQAKNWFYLAVGVTTAVIMIFWGYLMYGQLIMFEFKKTPEKNLMDENKKTWKEIFEAMENQERTKDIKIKLPEALSELRKATAEQATTTLITVLETTTTTLNLSPTSTNNQ